jgi:hypothetical protein
MTTQHRITSTLAVTVALTLAAGAPAAPANPAKQLYGPAGRPNQEKQINTTGSMSAPPTIVRISSPGGGFDWGDAGIGAAGGFAFSMLGLGGALAVSQRRTRHSDTAPTSRGGPIMVDTSSSHAAVRSIAPRLRAAIGIGLTALGVAVALTVMIVMLAPMETSRPTTRSQPRHNTVAHAARTSRLNAADWITLKNAIRLRTMALAPGRTPFYRSFAAYMGLSALMTLHPILPGRCATAVSYLYDNLLDLHDAYPGEDWRPRRRLIRRQPPLGVCAPKANCRVTYVG